MPFNDKFLLKNLRNRLTPKQKALFKLVVWVVLLVWMVFFLAYSILIAKAMDEWLPLVLNKSLFYIVLAKMIPYWYVFTTALIEFLIARWAYRKLKGKPTTTNNVSEAK